MSDIGFCAQRSKLFDKSDPETYFICTNDPGHDGDHTACDGQGHVLARWKTAESMIEAWVPGRGKVRL